MKKIFVVAFVMALVVSATPAAEKNAPVSADDAAGVNETIERESTQPMNRNEPMPTGMAKKGMKKGDVKARATKKDAVMNEMMKREEMKK